MEIATNTQATNLYSTTKQKENSSHDQSFDQHIKTDNQDELQTTQNKTKTEDYIEVNETTTQTETLVYTKEKNQSEPYDSNKVFLNFLDDNYPNYFEKNGISKEDEEAIRLVLADNKISEYEARNLTFKQAQTLHKIEFNRFEYGPENSDDMKFLPTENQKVQHIIRSTDFSSDNTLNKAIFQMFVEDLSLDAHEMTNIQGELSYTLKQAFNGMDLGFNMQQAPVPFGLLHEFENSEIDYESHLLKLLDHLDILFSKANNPDVKKQLENLNSGFAKILENYQELKNKEASQE